MINVRCCIDMCQNSRKIKYQSVECLFLEDLYELYVLCENRHQTQLKWMFKVCKQITTTRHGLPHTFHTPLQVPILKLAYAQSTGQSHPTGSCRKYTWVQYNWPGNLLILRHIHNLDNNGNIMGFRSEWKRVPWRWLM